MRFVQALAFSLVLLFAILSFGCLEVNLKDGNSTLEPVFSSNLSANAFGAFGCRQNEFSIDCSSIGLELNYSCIYDAYPVADYVVNALDPNAAIAQCWVSGMETTLDMPASGCMLPVYSSYLLLKEGRITQISSRDQFISLFGPVDSAEKALAFAIMLERGSPKYSSRIPEGNYWKIGFNPTKVVSVAGGFRVNLFEEALCGCGTHPVYEITYFVAANGSTEEISAVPAYENPNENICVD